MTQPPIQIVVASRNPVKVEATRRGFQRVFPGRSLRMLEDSVPSGVADQPMTDEETLLGAENRAREVARRHPDADFWVGVEGGVEDRQEGEGGGEMTVFAWIVVLSSENRGRSRTGTFVLPSAVTELVRAGTELGEADDIVFGRSGSKREDGAVGLLTGGLIDRAAYYEPSVVLALVPFRNPELYPSPLNRS